MVSGGGADRVGAVASLQRGQAALAMPQACATVRNLPRGSASTISPLRAERDGLDGLTLPVPPRFRSNQGPILFPIATPMIVERKTTTAVTSAFIPWDAR